jgi:hypothetical protein
MRRAVLALSRKRTCHVCLGALVPGGRPDTCISDPVELAARNSVRCPSGLTGLTGLTGLSGLSGLSGLTGLTGLWSAPPVRIVGCLAEPSKAP